MSRVNRHAAAVDLVLDYHGVDAWGVCRVDRPGAGPLALVCALAVRDEAEWLFVRRGGRSRLVADLLLCECLRDVARGLQARGFRAVTMSSQAAGAPSLVRLGELAGLGRRGRNGLLLHPEWGGWMQLGALFTDAPLPPAVGPPAPVCEACDRCLKACPAGAIGAAGVDAGRCAAHVAGPGARRPSPGSYVECNVCLAVCPVGRRPATLSQGG